MSRGPGQRRPGTGSPTMILEILCHPRLSLPGKSTVLPRRPRTGCLVFAALAPTRAYTRSEITMLVRCLLMVLLGAALGIGLFGACGSSDIGASEARAGIDEISILMVQSADPEGVAAADCPTDSVAVSVGCFCDLSADPSRPSILFTSEVVGNGGICGCFDSGEARATVVCLRGRPANAVRHGLIVDRRRELLERVSTYLQER